MSYLVFASLRTAFLSLLAISLVGCAHVPTSAQGSGEQIVASYLAALNRRDLLALTAYVAPDIEWYSIVKGERILEVSGREALEQSLRQYFERYAHTAWKIEAAQTSGQVVAVSERSEWELDGRKDSRSSLGVYEIDNGRIRRITYFLNDG